MGFAMGINAVMHAIPEVTYGVTPASGFNKLPFVSSNLGEERPLIEDDQLGFGREGLDPAYDVASNSGDIVVPVESEAIGFWLRALFGAPVNTGAGPTYSHAFESGKSALPSHSIEIGNPDVPTFSVHYGMMVNQMRIAMQRSGMLNATFSLMGQGESAQSGSSVAGTPVTVMGARFPQASGIIQRDATALGNIISASLSVSNNLEAIEAIRPDGRISGLVPGVVQAQLQFEARFDNLDLLNLATNGTPVNINDMGWTLGAHSLKFALPRLFLPRGKRPIVGPRGITQTFDCQASGRLGHKITAILVNATPAY